MAGIAGIRKGFAGQTGRQGYMLFLSVLIRPALMIFGFFLGSGLFTVFAWWVGQGIGVFEAQTARQAPWRAERCLDAPAYGSTG